MGNYDPVRELMRILKDLVPIMVTLDKTIGLSRHRFVWNVLRISSVLQSLRLTSNQLRRLILNIADY